MITSLPADTITRPIVLIEAESAEICQECFAEPGERCHVDCTAWHSQWFALIHGQHVEPVDLCARCGGGEDCTDWCEFLSDLALECLTLAERRWHFETACTVCGFTRSHDFHLGGCGDPYSVLGERECWESCCDEEGTEQAWLPRVSEWQAEELMR